MTEIQFKITPRTVQDIVNLFRNRQLNLSAVFQRASVWQPRDREKLIESIYRRYPIPAIFLYRSRHEDGELCYEVIDGKQRIESLLMFMGQIHGQRFSINVSSPTTGDREELDWKKLCRRRMQQRFTAYEIPTIEVDGPLPEIINLFVLINSTGKALTSAEKRHARFYNSEFLREAAKVARRFGSYFCDQHILSAGQITRMKDVELICELMVSIQHGQVINKKAALDSAMRPGSFTAAMARKISGRTVSALNRVRRIFPDLRNTRFKKISDFYSLAMLIAEFEHEGLVLTDRRQNLLARKLLEAFGAGVDQVREKQKTATAIDTGQELYREYLLTVLEGTDEISKRKKRHEMLKELLHSLFLRKDRQRLFSEEQRRILWNTTASRKCKKCGRLVSWEDFTADHIDPFSKGGRTKLANAALMHRSCNSAKGNR